MQKYKNSTFRGLAVHDAIISDVAFVQDKSSKLINI